MAVVSLIYTQDLNASRCKNGTVVIVIRPVFSWRIHVPNWKLDVIAKSYEKRHHAMVLKGDATDSEILKQGHLQHHIVTCLQSYAKAFVQHTADLLLLKRSISQISGNFCPTCLLGSSIRNQQKKNSVVEILLDIDIDFHVNPGLVEATYAWARGKPVSMVAGQSGADEGHLLRAFKRLVEVLQYARMACHRLGYQALETLMRDAHVAIMRKYLRLMLAEQSVKNNGLHICNDKGDKREERSELEARQCDTESPVPKTTPKLKGGPSAGSDFSKFYDAVGRDFESGAYGPRNE
ncbi:unnamed protein product [Mesocestoides corti]|uniref:ATP-dependent RNA helicase Ski2/MTR4 C-terminal domain-containing protein n=1 Tax=Mesocestoides corti TaxID=53468 RepID=A0A0R3UPN5_MESCO|nr:unnamed protein product [Mesocestoides corti]